ncbi:MAG: prolipoprotein diacylglyceryl transferase [Anaerolineales bacterium]|jgi:phosphatidylglycerol:prolipoprotein diacylglycerol transferase|nr:prolipoprotein diacylglyceryl transferase [Anaerolineales bacterium]
MFPILQLGPLALPVPALAVLLSLWLGLSLAEKLAPKRGLSADALYNLTFTTLLSGIAGARLFFAVQNFSAFVQTPLSLFSRETGSLDPFGGFAAALLAAFIYGRRAGLKFWATLDGLTPLLAVLAVGLGLAHLASGAAFGMETSLPWGIELWGATRHPTQLYEIGLALAILLFLGWKAKNNSLSDGSLFWLFVALTAGAQLFVEGLRATSTVLPGGVRVEQLLAWFALAGALIKADFFTKSQPETEKDHAATRQ